MRNYMSFILSALMLAAAGQAAEAQKQAPGNPARQEAREMPERGAAKRDAARERAERESEAAAERAGSAREDAEEMAEREREMAEERLERSEQSVQGADQAASRGSERSREMRERRDERKEIMEDYRQGQAELPEADLDDDAETESEGDEGKSRKPWWKFWGN